MFGSCCGISNVYQPLPVYGDHFKGDRILIATLGYSGLNKCPFLNSDHGRYRPIKVIEQHLAALSPEDKSQKSEKTYDHWITSPWIIHDYTKTSEFIVCQTTDPDGFIVNGATAKALKQLKLIWNEGKGNYDNLVVLIPYGGQYMEDEMKEIYEATNDGIIIVCAAGREGSDVVFPAALGTVISVGVAGTGPKGREIDVSIDFKTRPARLIKYNGKEVELPRDCGIAAARVVGLISLLVSRINSIMKERNEEEDSISIIQKMINYIVKNSKLDQKSAHLHTYVICELIVNEGNGSHDPQLGYGDGEQIILSLLEMKPSFLIQKLANIVCGHSITGKGNVEDDIISAEERSGKFHDLKGKNICVGIIDRFNKVAQSSGSIEMFDWQPLPKDLHGNKCAMVLRKISSECQILCLNLSHNTQNSSVNSVTDIFNDCKSEDTIDVISCSVSFPIFYLGLCTAFDKAVKAGKIIVFAAGNCGFSQQNSIYYPGRNGNIIVVGRGDGFYNRARYNSAGRELDFLAQVQCVKTSHASSGTSFAAPVVAGYIALLLEFIKKEMEHDKIEVWSGNKWKKVPISKAARNVYAMRALLKLLVVKPQVHSETEGFGCLNFSVLFPDYIVDDSSFTQSDAKAFSTELAKERIHETLKKLYKREAEI
uniref:Peptidase S8/S53 domain-containing protein n=1 Tax=Amphimedon queenslandica TaxID=400682 RepID=A0A1X7TW15_AMPQE